MKKNIVLISVFVLIFFLLISCTTFLDYLGDTAMYCLLPAQIAQKIAPQSLDGGDLDNMDETSDDRNSSQGDLNSAVFMAGILATAASQGTDLFNAVIKELSDVENLFKDEMFLQYEKDGKYYGVNIQNKNKICHITYGTISSKEDTDYSKGDALSKFIYDPREQDKGPNLSIVLDEYGLKGKTKSKGARYLWLDIKNNASKQSVGIKAFVEGDEAKFFQAVGGTIGLDKNTNLFDIEGIVKGYPLAGFSEISPKIRLYGVMDDSNAGAISAKLEDFGIQYTLSKSSLLKALNINDPIPFLNPKYTFSALLDYQVRNYLKVSGTPQSINDVKINGVVLALTKAVVKADSIKSDTPGATSFLPSGKLDFTSALKPLLSVDPPNNESSLPYYSNITENNGGWKSYTIEESSLPTKNDFDVIYDKPGA